jgi:hypothetical protein
VNLSTPISVTATIQLRFPIRPSAGLKLGAVVESSFMDEHAAFREQMRQQGEATLRSIAEKERLAAQHKPTSTFKSSADILREAKQRHGARLVVESSNREAEIVEAYNRPSEVGSPYATLSNEELLELDRIQKLEQLQKDEFQSQFVSMAQWCLNNRSFPATPQAAQTLVEWCRQRSLSLAHDNLNSGWQALQQSGQLRPNFSQANATLHDQHAEELRASGIRVDAAPDPRTASPAELEAFIRSQPPPTLQNLLPPSSAPDLFSEPLTRAVPYGQQKPSDF